MFLPSGSFCQRQSGWQVLSRINLSSNNTEYKADTDDMVKDVNNIFYEADNLSLKQKPLRKSTSKPKQM
jgi:hypothetical protein